MTTPQNAKWQRDKGYKSEIILLDGLTGAGKTMIMKIIDTYKNVSPPRFDYQLEQLCIAISCGKIEPNAGKQLLQLRLDQVHYDTSLSRELNFRYGDLSSVFKSKKFRRYLLRLFQEQEKLLQKQNFYEEEKNFFIVHQLLENADVLCSLQHKEIKRIIAIRHPFYLFDHWASYIGMHGTSERDFTVTVKGRTLRPWFINDFPERFEGHSDSDKAAVAICELTKKQLQFLTKNHNAKNVLVIEFEKFVLQPEKFLSNLSNLIGSSPKRIKSTLKKANLPRIHINDSIRDPIYRRYRAQNLTTKFSHKEDYLKLRDRISKSVSPWHFELFEEVAYLHEEKFGLWYE